MAEAVIFDMDGVLVDSEPFWRSVETAVFDDLGIDIRPLLGHGMTMGMRVDEVVGFFRSRLGFVAPDDATIINRIVAGVIDSIQREGELMDGVLDALDFCAASGLATALASGSTMPVISAVLDRFDLARRFPVVCSAQDDAVGKPHPAIFQRTAAELGVDPIGCVVLEDSLNGCIAAKAARMRVIAIPDGRHLIDPRFVIADLQLSSLTEFRHSPVIELLGLEVSQI